MAIKESPPPKGSPKWMATFADMSTLLLTFFVLMLSFANIDIESFKEMLGSVAEAYGVTTKVHGEYQAAMIEEEIAPTSEEADSSASERESEESTAASEAAEAEQLQMMQIAKMQSQISRSIRDNHMEEIATVIQGENGIRIRVNGYHVFGAGGADIKKGMFSYLDTLVEAMELFPYNLLVEGHTDNRPVYSDQFPSNWELSAARASAVVRYLVEKGVDPTRLSAIGYGEHYPIAENKDREQRAMNRRVEFILTDLPLRIADSEGAEES